MVEKLSREELIQDVRELSSILETAHPDPYINGGGKIAYHRRLQKLIMDILPEGMTKQDFFNHLQPFIAKIEDSHTNIYQDSASRDRENPGGIPLYFDAIDEKLYVSAVTGEDHLPLIGSLLVSVGGVQFEELVERQKNRVGFENLYNLLGFLGRFGTLYYRDSLKSLVPEWKNDNQIKVVLLHPNGEEKEHTFIPSKNIKYPLLQQKSKIDLPDSRGWLSYHFIDQKKNIALLRIDSMSTYREAFEYWTAVGMAEFYDLAKRVYKVYNDDTPPEDIKKIIPKIPSATELFLSLFKEMKKASSEYLIVDLRKCIGGFDIIISFFLYFLVGFEKAVSLMTRRSEVQKLSEFLHKSSEEGVRLEEIPYYHQVPLTINDYDFSGDPLFYSEEKSKHSFKKILTEFFEKMPTFFKEFSSGEFEAYYFPQKIVVLCSSVTASSAFDMMTNLNRLGAINVGIPSGQSGNHFGNVRFFELSNSKIKGSVSTKYFIAFPDKPLKHYIQMPQFQLTYEKLASYDFDKNSTLLYALEILEKLEN